MKQLAIQEYLRSGKTLTDLKQEYHIDCIVNDELDVVVFNYSALTPMNTEIGKEARALNVAISLRIA
jgi:thiamine monophosphate synthase